MRKVKPRKAVVYIAGKITGDKHYLKKFAKVERRLRKAGHEVINPARLNANYELEYEQYMHICYAWIDIADCIYFLPDWQESNGARSENAYAKRRGTFTIHKRRQDHEKSR